MLSVDVQEPLRDVKVAAWEGLPWLLDFALNDVDLGPAMFQPLAVLLLSPKVSLSHHLLIHTCDWVSGDVKLTCGGCGVIVLMVASHTHIMQLLGVGTGSLLPGGRQLTGEAGPVLS